MSRPPEYREPQKPVVHLPDAGATPERYSGLATRVIAAVVDAGLINLVAVAVEVGAALIISLLHLPHSLDKVIVAIGGAAYVLWTLGYFITFWSTTGQTPGNRVMQIRVVTASGDALGPGRAFLRCIGVVLAALPLFAGFLLILFDTRRRGLQDRIAGTLVIEAPGLSAAAQLRAERQVAPVSRSSLSGDAVL